MWLFLRLSKREESQGRWTPGATACVHVNFLDRGPPLIWSSKYFLRNSLPSSYTSPSPTLCLEPMEILPEQLPSFPRFLDVEKHFTNPGARLLWLPSCPRPFSCLQWLNKPFLLNRLSAVMVKIFVPQSLWVIQWLKLTFSLHGFSSSISCELFLRKPPMP